MDIPVVECFSSKVALFCYSGFLWQHFPIFACHRLLSFWIFPFFFLRCKFRRVCIQPPRNLLSINRLMSSSVSVINFRTSDTWSRNRGCWITRLCPWVEWKSHWCDASSLSRAFFLYKNSLTATYCKNVVFKNKVCRSCLALNAWLRWVSDSDQA